MSESTHILKDASKPGKEGRKAHGLSSQLGNRPQAEGRQQTGKSVFSLAALQKPQLSILDNLLDAQDKKEKHKVSQYSATPRSLRERTGEVLIDEGEDDVCTREETTIVIGEIISEHWGPSQGAFMVTVCPFRDLVEVGWRSPGSVLLHGVGRRIVDSHFGEFKNGHPFGLGMRKLYLGDQRQLSQFKPRDSESCWVLKRWIPNEDLNYLFDLSNLLNRQDKETIVISDCKGRTSVICESKLMLYGDDGLKGFMWSQEKSDSSLPSDNRETTMEPKIEDKFGLAFVSSSLRGHESFRKTSQVMMVHLIGTTYTYTGEVHQGSKLSGLELPKPNGFGKQQSNTSSENYVGFFVNGQKHGKGTERLSTGEIFVGSFQTDVRSGPGCLVCKLGSRYVGEYKNNQKCGVGKYLQGNSEYIGEWRNDFQNGLGILIDHLMCLGTLSYWSHGRLLDYRYTFRVVDRKIIISDDLGLVGERPNHQIPLLTAKLVLEKFELWEKQINTFEGEIDQIVHQLEAKQSCLSKFNANALSQFLKRKEESRKSLKNSG